MYFSLVLNIGQSSTWKLIGWDLGTVELSKAIKTNYHERGGGDRITYCAAP